MKKRDLEIGDVVQLKPDYGNGFGGMLVVVTEPKEFGCQGYLMAYHSVNAVTWKGKAYLRPSWADMEYVGKLHWLEADGSDTEVD